MAGAAAPILVVLPSMAGDAADPQVGADTPILGLTLGRRTTLAARRAGFAQVFFLDQVFFLGQDFLDKDRPVESGAAIRDWSALAATLGANPAMIVIVPAAILSETAWLKHVIAMPEPVTWALLSNRVAVLGGDAAPGALATLNTDGVHDISTVAQSLTHSIGPPAALASDVDPMLVATRDAIPGAERRLLRSLVKDSDGFITRHVDRRISLQITRRLASTDVKPSQVTIISMAIGLAGALFFLSAHWAWQTVGALLFLLHSIVDGCDGELARLKFQESRAGGVLDFWSDNIVHVAVFGCIAVGWAWSSAAAWPLWFGVAAILGTAASAMFVYWTQLREKEGGGPLFTSLSGSPEHGLGRAVDTMSSREFIYALPIVTFFGQTHWIVVLAAIGAPAFFLVLLVLAMRQSYRANAVSSLTR